MGARLALVSMVCLAAVAHAHDADVIYAQVLEGPAGQVQEELTLTVENLFLLAPVDADGDRLVTQEELVAREASIRVGVWEDLPLSAGGVRCQLGAREAQLRPGFVALRANWHCGEGELHQDFRILRVLPSNYRVVLGTQLEGERAGKRFAQGQVTGLVIPRASGQRPTAGGFPEGLRRAAHPAWLAAIVGLLAFKTRRRSVLAGLGLIAGVTAGTLLPLAVPGLVPAAVVVIAAMVVSVLETPPVVVALAWGLGLGMVDAGGDAPERLLLAAGTVVALLGPASIAVAATQRVTAGEGWRTARWSIVTLAVLGAAMWLSR